MSSLHVRSLMSLRLASDRRALGRARRRLARRFAPRLVPLEVRALLSTITVTNDNDSGSGSLRAAIAGVSSGDTIDFAASAYGTITLTSGPLEVPNVNLTIQGPGANKLTISGDNTYTVLELGMILGGTPSPATMTISGLTIANGNAPSFSSGGGIADGVNLTLSNSVLKDNQAPLGNGGAFSDESQNGALSLAFDNDLFEDNTAGSASADFVHGKGGAIDSENGSTVSVNSSTFINNEAISTEAQGGAINLSANPFAAPFPIPFGSISVTNSVFSGNTAYSNPSVQSFGASAAGGAIWADAQVGVSISSSQFLGNEANVAGPSGSFAVGGAIAVNPGAPTYPLPPPSSVVITTSLFAGNSAVGTGTMGTQAQGGAIDAGVFDGNSSGGGTLEITDTTFSSNRAESVSPPNDLSDEFDFEPAQGGAIATTNNALALMSDTFTNNQAVAGSGQNTQSVFGGAIYSELSTFPTLTSTISDSLFVGNQAIGGSGLPSAFNNEVEGGALALTDTPTKLTNTSFIDNQALGSRETGVPSSPVFFGPLALGGAVEASGAAISVSGGLISGNVARGGNGGDASAGAGAAGGYAWGGGIFVGGQGALTLEGSTISNNSAIGGAGGNGQTGGSGGYGQGGGIYVYYGGSATLSKATMIGNSAIGGAGGGGATPGLAGDAQGGAVFEYAGTLKISGGTIVGNSAVGGQNGGDGEGGGVFVSGTGANAALTGVLVALNSALGGSGNGKGYGGGLYLASGVVTLLTKTTVIGNSASTAGNDIYGTYTTG
jgi:hypothetical protein